VQPAPASPLVTRHAIVFRAAVGEKFGRLPLNLSQNGHCLQLEPWVVVVVVVYGMLPNAPIYKFSTVFSPMSFFMPFL
jgi:hypothetical protein